MDEKNVSGLEKIAPDRDGCKKILRMADYLRYHGEADHIPDPYYGNDSLYEEVLDLLEDSCQGLLEKLSEE